MLIKDGRFLRFYQNTKIQFPLNFIILGFQDALILDHHLSWLWAFSYDLSSFDLDCDPPCARLSRISIL